MTRYQFRCSGVYDDFMGCWEGGGVVEMGSEDPKRGVGAMRHERILPGGEVYGSHAVGEEHGAGVGDA